MPVPRNALTVALALAGAVALNTTHLVADPPPAFFSDQTIASGLIAGEGVMGIGTAVAALIVGRRPEGFGFGLTGATGSVVSLAR